MTLLLLLVLLFCWGCQAILDRNPIYKYYTQDPTAAAAGAAPILDWEPHRYYHDDLFQCSSPRDKRLVWVGDVGERSERKLSVVIQQRDVNVSLMLEGGTVEIPISTDDPQGFTHLDQHWFTYTVRIASLQSPTHKASHGNITLASRQAALYFHCAMVNSTDEFRAFIGGSPSTRFDPESRATVLEASIVRILDGKLMKKISNLRFISTDLYTNVLRRLSLSAEGERFQFTMRYTTEDSSTGVFQTHTLYRLLNGGITSQHGDITESLRGHYRIRMEGKLMWITLIFERPLDLLENQESVWISAELHMKVITGESRSILRVSGIADMDRIDLSVTFEAVLTPWLELAICYGSGGNGVESYFLRDLSVRTAEGIPLLEYGYHHVIPLNHTTFPEGKMESAWSPNSRCQDTRFLEEIRDPRAKVHRIAGHPRPHPQPSHSVVHLYVPDAYSSASLALPKETAGGFLLRDGDGGVIRFDETARLLRDHADQLTDDGKKPCRFFTHGLGGQLTLHIYAYYWSCLDIPRVMTVNDHLLQTVSTAWKGSPVGEHPIAMSSIYNGGAPSSILTPEGASRWFKSLPEDVYSAVHNVYTHAPLGMCHPLTDLLLEHHSNDGYTVVPTQTAGGGVVVMQGWCHLMGMTAPQQWASLHKLLFPHR